MKVFAGREYEGEYVSNTIKKIRYVPGEPQNLSYQVPNFLLHQNTSSVVLVNRRGHRQELFSVIKGLKLSMESVP